MIRSNLLVFGGTLVVSTLMLAACGGSTPTVGATSAVTSHAATSAGAPSTSAAAAAGGVPDGCSLITSQEASVALGVDAGTPSGAGGTCDYGTATIGSIHIVASMYPDSSSAQSLYAGARTAAKGGLPGFQDVSGIGDMAFVTSEGFMEFSKGSTVVLIQVLSSATPSASTMTTLGQAAAGRV
jgi:hypothetical protein